MSPLEKILGKLGRYRHAGNGYRAKCPGHDGQSADSLSLTEAEDGAALIHCFSGCDHHRVLHALGLDAQDLFPEGDVRRNSPRPKGGKLRQPKPPKTDEDKLILMLTAHHISGLLIGPPPTTLPDETMGPYVGLVELLGEVFQQGGHDAVQVEWVNLQPALAESAPRLCDAVNRRVRTASAPRCPGRPKAASDHLSFEE